MLATISTAPSSLLRERPAGAGATADSSTATYSAQVPGRPSPQAGTARCGEQGGQLRQGRTPAAGRPKVGHVREDGVPLLELRQARLARGRSQRSPARAGQPRTLEPPSSTVPARSPPRDLGGFLERAPHACAPACWRAWPSRQRVRQGAAQHLTPRTRCNAGAPVSQAPSTLPGLQGGGGFAHSTGLTELLATLIRISPSAGVGRGTSSGHLRRPSSCTRTRAWWSFPPSRAAPCVSAGWQVVRPTTGRWRPVRRSTGGGEQPRWGRVGTNRSCPCRHAQQIALTACICALPSNQPGWLDRCNCLVLSCHRVALLPVPPEHCRAAGAARPERPTTEPSDATRSARHRAVC